MVTQKNRDIRLKSRPVGLPTLDNFELVEGEIPHLGSGQILVRNLFMSVDPYMRGRMMDRKSYVPPFQIGEVLQGGAVGKVMVSNGNGEFAAGDYVLGMDGWREWFVSSGAGLQKVDPAIAPIQAYLGALGMPGLTAYAGLLRVGELKKTDRVFVSAASGAVGAVVCQIARNKGCEIVVGSAGTDEKCAYLTQELGCTAAINYRDCGDLGAALADAMPGGVDVYFDNVGGSHLTAALDNMNTFGRIVACGMIEIYNATEPPRGPYNLANIVGRSLTMRGFIVLNHLDMLPAFQRDMGEWIAAGKMTWRETILDGIERAPEALIGLFKGDNFGKMLVKLAEENGG
ncbi:MAG: NADP-dependent oxidoreductase [Alphaproteobacteria bacterium]|nr:NADP-dependent oxidoreductase [Alphaproteobacteria bacterium]MDE2110201.1 NADP-dependent oxidoreductase [Alphaproteobacteria bacterium]MDE2494130.1 NADP-dependent oxidoreductase [Alphaproteobacteria bacterium]